MSIFKTDPEILRAKFRAMQTDRDVASLLEISYSQLTYHLYRVSPSQKYAEFEIPKKSGKLRKISAPITALKIIQENLNFILSLIYSPKKCVHGFIREKSVLTNARMHCGMRYVLNIDLNDFFPSINFGRIS